LRLLRASDERPRHRCERRVLQQNRESSLQKPPVHLSYYEKSFGRPATSGDMSALPQYLP
jgi:hypothetical protein